MSSGKIASVDLTGGVNTTLYTMPTIAGSNKVTVGFSNRTDGDAHIRLALVGVDLSLTDADWLEYDMPLRKNGIIERSNIAMATGDYLVVYSDISKVSVTAWGETW
jgi:hypothetical protein